MHYIIKVYKRTGFFQRFKISGICVFLVILSACQTRKIDEKNEKYYYDLKGFIDNQIVNLDENKPVVSKTAILGEKTETAKTTAINWQKELELFLQADINKPSYRLSYVVSRKDSTEYEYKLKPNIQLPVQYLKIVTDTVANQPVYIKALLKSENKIYKSEKEIELRCSKISNLWQLSSISVQGYQKLIFMDKKSFQITSKIGL